MLWQSETLSCDFFETADCDSRCNPLLQRPNVPKPANLSDAPKLLAKFVTRQTPSPSFKIIFGCFDFNSVRMIAFISALIIDKDDQDDRWTCQMIKQDEQDDQNENGRRTWQQARGRRSGQPAPRGWVQGTWNGTLPNSYVQGAQISDVFLLPKCITLSWEKGDDGKQCFVKKIIYWIKASWTNHVVLFLKWKFPKRMLKNSSWQEQIEENLSIEVFLCWASSASATLFQNGGVSIQSSRNSFKSKEKRKHC